MMTATAVCVILRDGDKVLAVSRKDNPEDFGLPGGKVDPGETPEEAAIRETYEETGVRPLALTPVYTAPCGKHVSTCFLCTRWEGSPSSLEAGVVSWLLPQDLTQTGSFVHYNQAALAAALGQG